jgi:hypothetical protein
MLKTPRRLDRRTGNLLVFKSGRSLRYFDARKDIDTGNMTLVEAFFHRLNACLFYNFCWVWNFAFKELLHTESIVFSYSSNIWLMTGLYFVVKYIFVIVNFRWLSCIYTSCNCVYWVYLCVCVRWYFIFHDNIFVQDF